MSFEKSVIHHALTKGNVPSVAVEIMSKLMPKQELAETIPDLVAMQSPKIGDRFPQLDKNTLEIILRYATDRDNYKISNATDNDQDENTFILSHKTNKKQFNMSFERGRLVSVINENVDSNAVDNDMVFPLYKFKYTADGQIGFIERTVADEKKTMVTTWQLSTVKSSMIKSPDKAIVMVTTQHIKKSKLVLEDWYFKQSLVFRFADYTFAIKNLPSIEILHKSDTFQLLHDYPELHTYMSYLGQVGITPHNAVPVPMDNR